jgi:hypothetical protein
MTSTEEALNKEVRRGWGEAIAWSTVGLTPPTSVPVEKHKHGSGVAIEFEERVYIATAQHVVQELLNLGFNPNQFSFMVRPEVPLEFNFAGRIPARVQGMSLREAISLPVLDLHRSTPEEDLALIELDGSAKQRADLLRFVQVGPADTSPDPGKWAIVFGMASEMLMTTGPVGRHLPMAIGPYALESVVQEYRPGMLAGFAHQFDPSLHYLGDFETGRGAGSLQSPAGMSGGGAWLPNLLRNSKLWSPRVKLAGILLAWYPSVRYIKIARMERLAAFLTRLAQSTET